MSIRHNVEFKHLPPPAGLRDLIEDLVRRLERHARGFPEDAMFLRVFVDVNAARTRYRVSVTCSVPGRTLAAQKERHDADEAVREAFAEIDRQLEQHRERSRHEDDYKRPGRREAARLARAGVVPPDRRAVKRPRRAKRSPVRGGVQKGDVRCCHRSSIP